MTIPRYVVIANPVGKRWEHYRRDLFAFWAERGGEPDVAVVPWADVVPRDGNLDDLPAFDRPAVVRLESPGRDTHVTRLLLEAGGRDDPAEPPADWRNLNLPKGLLVRPGLAHRGFVRVLRGLKASFAARPHLSPTACPLAVAEMFDKNATLARLTAAGVPVPDWLPPDQIPGGAVALSHRLRDTGWPVVYVKLNTGSSATGIVVASYRPGQPVRGVTTLAWMDGQFYNSRLLRAVEDVGVAHAYGFLLREGATVQRGVPMAQLDGQNFDVRVVCVYGAPVCSIFRLSSKPMTNLHLGGRRGDWAACRAAVPTRRWLDALDHCSDAAGCFDAAVAGVDVVFERGYAGHAVLEVNAFGDFFPGWADAHGVSVHRHEIAATAGRFCLGERPA